LSGGLVTHPDLTMAYTLSLHDALPISAQIAHAISESGYPSTPQEDSASPAEHEEHRLMHQARHARSWLIRAIVGIALWLPVEMTDRKSTRLNSSHEWISYAVFCLNEKE